MKYDYNRNDTFVLTATDGVREIGDVGKFAKNGEHNSYFYCTEGYKVLYQWCKPTIETKAKNSLLWYFILKLKKVFK